MSLWIDYTNYRGERSIRQITVMSAVWGSNEYHPEPQVLVAAVDHGKNAVRCFALKDIRGWYPTEDAAKAAQPGAGVREALEDILQCAETCLRLHPLEGRQAGRFVGKNYKRAATLRNIEERARAALASFLNGGDSGSDPIGDLQRGKGHAPGGPESLGAAPSAPVGAPEAVTEALAVSAGRRAAAELQPDDAPAILAGEWDGDFFFVQAAIKGARIALALAQSQPAPSAETVRALRERSGSGLMDCKAALAATGNDFDKAVEWLRRKGWAAQPAPSARPAEAEMAKGCCSAISPCRHQQRDPFTVCEQCRAALAPSPDSGSATAAREMGGEASS